jgi:hypothetical protein
VLTGKVAQPGTKGRGSGGAMRVGQRDQQPLPDRSTHGGPEQLLASPSVRGEYSGHGDAAEITNELVESIGGGRHPLDVSEPDPARYRGGSVLDTDGVRGAEHRRAAQHDGGMPEQVVIAGVLGLGGLVGRRHIRGVGQAHPASGHSQPVGDTGQHRDGLHPSPGEDLRDLGLSLLGGERNAGLAYPRVAQNAKHGRDVAARERMARGRTSQQVGQLSHRILHAPYQRLHAVATRCGGLKNCS